MLRYPQIIFAVISISEGCRSGVTKIDRTSSLPIPIPKHYVISNGPKLTVRWDPVEVREDNPILGFKIKIWEEEKNKLFKFVEKCGEQVLVEELVASHKSLYELPTHKPAFEAVVPPDVFEARFDIKRGEMYQLRGQSYNADGDGPLSQAFGLRVGLELGSEDTNSDFS